MRSAFGDPLLGGHLDRAVSLPAVAGRLGDEPQEAGREGDRRHDGADRQRGGHHRCAGEVDAPPDALLDAMRSPTAIGAGRLDRMTGAVTGDGAVGGTELGVGRLEPCARRAVRTTIADRSASQAAPPMREQREVDLEARGSARRCGRRRSGSGVTRRPARRWHPPCRRGTRASAVLPGRANGLGWSCRGPPTPGCSRLVGSSPRPSAWVSGDQSRERGHRGERDEAERGDAGGGRHVGPVGRERDPELVGVARHRDRHSRSTRRSTSAAKRAPPSSPSRSRT